ncbi:hypothetical protein [Saccharopolyspora phatthalungensis]|uniref:Uncharacterized protein n=1 Tax=Saccharopolyspora phatthalungensis TaxID=664693 RepID=A0A840Q7D5_9PSEU|nr:hypothetical protein [Saccharopolyspora phatthalungensis]MBB5156594.1 hypothetical protein [Saccharopolyspora phatthalungensis]
MRKTRLAVLGATGIAAAAEDPQIPDIDKILSSTLLDVSKQDGASQNGKAHESTQSKDDPQVLPDPQPRPSKPNIAQQGDDDSDQQQSSVDGQDSPGKPGGVDGPGMSDRA